MRWLVTLVFLAGIGLDSPPAKAQGGPNPLTAPPQPIPTTPQVPDPQIIAVQVPATTSQAETKHVKVTGTCTDGNCANKPNCLQKLKNWVCFCPSAGDALPKLRIHPYMGPYVGTFYCTSAPGSTCGAYPGGSCGSCGAKTGYVAAPPPPPPPPAPPADTSIRKTSVEKSIADPSAVIVVPPLPVQGFPRRGCQGGSTNQAVPAAQSPEQ